MDQIASYVLTVLIEKNMIFTILFYFHKLTFALCFSSTPISLGFFSTKLQLVHLKIGTCSFNIMLNNNFNSLTPWDSQDPYNPRLKLHVPIWASSLGKLKKKENSNYQHYNIISAYETKDETSTSSTYASLVFYRTVRSKKILVKK
jgi:hypothetical protein